MRIQGNISTVPGRSWFNTQFSREFEKTVVEMRETEKERVGGRERERRRRRKGGSS